MALKTLRTPLDVPAIPRLVSGNAPGFLNTTLVLDAANERAGVVLQPPKTGLVRGVATRTGNVTAGGTSNLTVQAETVGSGGDPAGLWATDTSCSFDLQDADDNSWLDFGDFTADVSITTLDTLLALTVNNPAANFGNFQLSAGGLFLGNSAGRPYALLNTGSWVKQNLIPIIALRYSDGSYACSQGCWPCSNFNGLALNTGSSPDEAGLRFRLPYRARVKGWWQHFLLAGTSSDFDLILYDQDGTSVLLTRSVKASHLRSTTHQSMEELYNGSAVIEPNTWYRLVVKPTTANSVTQNYLEVASAAIMDAVPGGEGQDFHWTERTDGGSWTDIATRRPFMGLKLDQISDDDNSGVIAPVTPHIFVPRRLAAY